MLEPGQAFGLQLLPQAGLQPFHAALQQLLADLADYSGQDRNLLDCAMPAATIPARVAAASVLLRAVGLAILLALNVRAVHLAAAVLADQQACRFPCEMSCCQFPVDKALRNND